MPDQSTLPPFADLLDTYPPAWPDARLQALHDAFSRTIYRSRDIEAVVLAAALDPSLLPWDEPARRLWFAAFNEASKAKLLPDVVAAGAASAKALARRVDELRAAVPTLPAAPAEAPAQGDFTGFSPGSRLERQIVAGMPTLLDVRFLALGLARAAAVCKVEANFGWAVSSGTGFRIGRRSVLTNHHVVYDEDHGDEPARGVQLLFRHEVDVAGDPAVPVVVNGVASALRGERGEDWAVVTTAADLPDDIPVLGISGPAEAPARDDRVCIIQHPNGLPKKVALHHNLVRHADDTVVQYWTDTDEGSSGAPVFDERWEVVALHHATVEAPGDDYAHRNQGRAIARVSERIAAVMGAVP